MDETGRLNLEEKRESEYVKLAYLFCWPTASVCLVCSQGMNAGFEAQVDELGLNLEEKNCDLLEIGEERKDRPQQVISYRVGSEVDGFEFGEEAIEVKS